MIGLFVSGCSPKSLGKEISFFAIDSSKSAKAISGGMVVLFGFI